MRARVARRRAACADRQLAIKYHPDKNHADDKALCEERFKAVAYAYEVLSSAADRATYDRLGKKGLLGAKLERDHASVSVSSWCNARIRALLMLALRRLNASGLLPGRAGQVRGGARRARAPTAPARRRRC